MDDPPATYELIFRPREGYLHALIRSDTMTADMATEYLGRVAEKCDELYCDRVLIERDVPVTLSDSDLFHVTQYFFGLMGNRRVAFVNPHAKINEYMDFGITISTNRGANFRLFNGVAEAEAWLAPLG